MKTQDLLELAQAAVDGAGSATGCVAFRDFDGNIHTYKLGRGKLAGRVTSPRLLAQGPTRAHLPTEATNGKV